MSSAATFGVCLGGPRQSRPERWASTVLAWLVLWTALLVPTTAQSQESQGWSETVSPDALESYMPEGTTTVLVIHAGENDAQGAELASVCIGQLERDGLEAVGGSIWDGSDLGDADLVDTIDAGWADAILIVRVLSGDRDPEYRLFGTVFRPDGEVFSNFTVYRGETLLPRDSRAAGDDQGRPNSSHPAKRSDQTQARFVGGQDDDNPLLYVEMQGSETNATFFRGESKTPISARTFLEELDRPDLVAEMDRRKRVKKGLVWGGVGTVAASAGLLAVGAAVRSYGGTCPYSPDISRVERTKCLEADRRHRTAYGLTSGALFLGGLTLTTAGLLKTPFPIQAEHAQELADQHNEQLNHDTSGSSSRRGAPRPVEIEVGVGGPGKGAGLVVRGRF